jgi:hypothetical protein
MRLEGAELRCAAGVGEPRPRLDPARRPGDCPIRHAEENELRVRTVEVTAGERDVGQPLGEPREDGLADATGADDACRSEHLLQLLSGYRALSA